MWSELLMTSAINCPLWSSVYECQRVECVRSPVRVVVVCPLQPYSSVSSGCPGPESSILVSSRWACPISSQVTDH